MIHRIPMPLSSPVLGDVRGNKLSNSGSLNPGFDLGEGFVTSCAAASDDPVSRWTTSLKVSVSASTNVVNAFESFTVFFVGTSMSSASNAEHSSIWQEVLIGRTSKTARKNREPRKPKLCLHLAGMYTMIQNRERGGRRKQREGRETEIKRRDKKMKQQGKQQRRSEFILQLKKAVETKQMQPQSNGTICCAHITC